MWGEQRGSDADALASLDCSAGHRVVQGPGMECLAAISHHLGGKQSGISGRRPVLAHWLLSPLATPLPGLPDPHVLQLALDAVNLLRRIVHSVKLNEQRLKEQEEMLDISIDLQTVPGARRQAEPIQLARGGGGTGAVRSGTGRGTVQGPGILAGRTRRERLHPFKVHLVTELQRGQQNGPKSAA